ncbi:MAG: 6-bladed beta-propeller [Tannerella sp.]|jgi:hypothetical protein|nr:6-bladed beta-propeller [Tannerella sp.]
MKANDFLQLIAIMIFSTGCSSNKQSKDCLPYIDLSRNYPEKNIILTDIADVSYVHLTNKECDDYLYKGTIRYITENIIVIADESAGSILFFSKDGNPKSRFNHYGSGPEEYPCKGRDIPSFVYDETGNDVFISYFNIILVYSSMGEYKRKIILPPSTRMSLVDFDDQSLFVYDGQKQFDKFIKKTAFPHQSIDSSFFRISKTDGKILDYVIIPNNEKDLTDCGGGRVLRNFGNMRRCAAGLLLSNPETDTVFLYMNDKSIAPVFCKKPLVDNVYPKAILSNFMDVGRYQFMTVETLFNLEDIGKFPYKYYIHDKQTGEIFRQKVVLSDYKGKELFISAKNTLFNGKETLAYFELDLFELKQAYRENKLNGKLKELVATLNEYEDNNVFMLVNFN